MSVGAFWDEDVNRWYVEMDGNTVCHGLTEISAKNLRDVLDRLRAENSDTKAHLQRVIDDFSSYVHLAEADNVTKDARIAELERDNIDLDAEKDRVFSENGGLCMDLNRVKDELAEAKAALARTEAEAQVCMAGTQAALEAANARTGKCGMEGHNEPCHYCGESCNSLVGNPGKWPVALCHGDEPGVVKWHHTGCVMGRLLEGEAANARNAEMKTQFEAYKVNYEFNDVDLDMAVELEQTLRKTAEARAERAEARIAELENINKEASEFLGRLVQGKRLAEAECKTMREALEPFATEYDEDDPAWWSPDDNSSISINGRQSDLTVGDFRKARAALNPSTAGRGG